MHRSRAGLFLILCALHSVAPVVPARSAPDATAFDLCLGGACRTVPSAFDRWDDARRLRYGYGMTSRDEIAVRWFERSAKDGDARAMHNLGIMLLEGQGVPPDPAAALTWLSESHARGVTESALALGHVHRLGRGVPADAATAASFYRMAALRADARGMHALANLHATGRGVPHSPPDAYFWYRLASLRGHAMAEVARQRVAGDLSLVERERLDGAARAWRRGDAAP